MGFKFFEACFSYPQVGRIVSSSQNMIKLSMHIKSSVGAQSIFFFFPNLVDERKRNLEKEKL